MSLNDKTVPFNNAVLDFLLEADKQAQRNELYKHIYETFKIVKEVLEMLCNDKKTTDRVGVNLTDIT